MRLILGNSDIGTTAIRTTLTDMDVEKCMEAFKSFI